MHVGECPDNFRGGDGVWRCSVLFVAAHTKESVVACNVRFASLLVNGLVLNLVKNPCRSEHATILSVLNILVIDVKNTTVVVDLVARLCEFSKCAKVGNISLVATLHFLIELRLLTRQTRSEKRPATLAPAERGPSTVFGVGLGCKIQRRQFLHTEARPGWHTCASDPLLVLEPHYELQLSERWNRSDPALDMPCELHEQKPESKD